MDLPFRVGQGYDFHRLTEGRPLILGGVNIPFVRGLAGHSDADVLVHAIIDAVLGAAGLGDIGKHFPDNDNSYLGADSIALAQKVHNMITAAGYSVINIDATVIAQRPKLAPYTSEMCKNISEVFLVDAVNIKATTEEGMGPTGLCEAISAHAVVLLAKKY